MKVWVASSEHGFAFGYLVPQVSGHFAKTSALAFAFEPQNLSILFSDSFTHAHMSVSSIPFGLV